MDNQSIGIKVAFIGCGNIAHVHMRFMKKAGYIVDAACDTSQLRVDLFAVKYNIDRRFTDVDTLLSVEKPQVVHILTPPHTHYALIMKSLAAGSNVLVEKPICQSMKEYNEIILLASDKGLLVSVDHTRVYNPMIVQARKRYMSGEIGRIIRMEYAYDDPSLVKSESKGDSYRWAKGVPAWFAKIKGGVATDLLPHPLSVLLGFDEHLDIKQVQSHTVPGGIIDELTVMLHSEKSNAIINISLNQKPLKNTCSIYGDKGSIRIDLRNMFSVYQRDRRLPGILSRVLVALSESWQIIRGFVVNVLKLVTGKAHTYDGLDKIIKTFYEAVHNGSCYELPLINTRRVTVLVDEIITAALGSNYMDIDKSKQLDNLKLSQPADYLIFGGTGFIGRHIIDCLISNAKTTRAFCRSTSSMNRLPHTVDLVFGDLRDSEAVATSLNGVKYVIHCAAAMCGDWAEFYESTVQGTRNILSALDLSSVERLIYISSLGVLDYNKLKNGSMVDESSPVESKPADRGFYTRAKVEAEELVIQFASKNPQIKVVILRPGLVYGNESNNNLQNCGILLDKFLIVFGLGNRSLGLNYVENLANAVILAADAELANGTIIHIVDTEQPTVRKIIQEHNKICEQKISPIYIPVVVWKIIFIAVDLLMMLRNKKLGTFRYRFASNAKLLNYCSDYAQKNLGSFSQFNFRESFQKSYQKLS